MKIVLLFKIKKKNNSIQIEKLIMSGTLMDIVSNELGPIKMEKFDTLQSFHSKYKDNSKFNDVTY